MGRHRHHCRPPACEPLEGRLAPSSVGATSLPIAAESSSASVASNKGSWDLKPGPQGKPVPYPTSTHTSGPAPGPGALTTSVKASWDVHRAVTM